MKNDNKAKVAVKTTKVNNPGLPTSEPESFYYTLYFMVLVVAVIVIAGLYITQKLYLENTEYIYKLQEQQQDKTGLKKCIKELEMKNIYLTENFND